MDSSRTALRPLALASLSLLAACTAGSGPPDSFGEPPTIQLADRFDEATVEGELPELGGFSGIDWRFDRPFEPVPAEEPEGEDAEAEEAAADEADEDALPGAIVHGVEAVLGIEQLEVADGRLRGEVTGPAALRLERVAEGDEELYGIELRLSATAGTRVGATFERPGRFDRAEARKELRKSTGWPASAELIADGAPHTYLLELSRRSPASEVRHVLLQPSDEAGARFELESVRLVTMREHLATQPANVAWRGLGEIYRRTLTLHGTETVRFDLHLPSRPWLDLAVGTTAAHPTTFLVHVESGGARERILRRTVTTPDRWEETPLDLSEWADRRVSLTFSIETEEPEQVGFYGTLAVRNRGAAPLVDGAPLPEAPRAVILVLADTLRRDHLDAYGYERPTAPFLARLASEGARFEDAISQATWTKVSVSSILTSLYPTSHGILDMADKLPASVTTLAENFQRAGYATFATSSVVFSGRATNLQQGLDVLHERSSVGQLGHSSSKTARTFVDRLLAWIEARPEQPFFAFLHVFDPHSPFETYEPFGGLWASPTATEEHAADIAAVEAVEEDIGRGGGDKLPDLEDFEAAKVPHEPFVAREKDWYDESIRAMDAELARLFERLEELGLASDALIVLTSDHGEEFLEHGRHFHGNNAYGELTNVPLLVWGPDRVPPRDGFGETVQTIDVYPTILDLCGLPPVEGVQGQSLAPLIRGTAGFRTRPAFAERYVDEPDEPTPTDRTSFAMISDGYRLIHNTVRPEGFPEYELYDHANDPLNLHDLAAEQPERVESMARELALWRKWAEASRIEPSGEVVELTSDDLDQLRGLGYVGD